MTVHNSVPTTCTASLMTGWSLGSNLIHKDEKIRLRAILNALKTIKNGGYKEDFAILHAFTTQSQIEAFGLDEFMPLCGFQKVFRGKKSYNTSVQRHQETGDISLWAVEPSVFKECVEKSLKEIQDRLDVIDPPKKPDPARQKWPKIAGVTKSGIIQENANLNNKVSSVLKVPPTAAAIYFRTHYGIDFREWRGRGDSWVDMTFAQLRREHDVWKAELI